MFQRKDSYRPYVGKKTHTGNLRPLFVNIAAAILLAFVCEWLGRHSIGAAGRFLLRSPHLFLYNSLIIFVTLAVGLFFHRGYFVSFLIGLAWLLFGITNSIVLASRTLPFCAADLQLLPETFEILTVYFTPWQIAGMGVIILLSVAGIVLMYRKLPRRKPRFGMAVFSFCTALAVAITIAFTALEEVNISPNLVESYRHYGFPYSFTVSLLSRGAQRPRGYSKQMMAEIADRLELKQNDAVPADGVQPNIIVLQLESFFDATHIRNITFSADPAPQFRALRDSCESGELTVPTADGGTISTEFEVLTGMSLDYFAPGEYPYNTYLHRTACESMAYNLRERGYSTAVIHNNDRKFYGRDVVFGHLGFDDFVALESMPDAEQNELGWTRDEVLLSQIEKKLNETSDHRDFLYCISVQGHGKYPTEELDYERHLTVSGEEDPERHASLEFYINQLWETDRFLGELVQILQEREEPTVLLLFGDHMPDLSLSDEDLTEGGIFTTEYVLWKNYGEPAPDHDLSSYQLSALTLERAGYANGVLTKLHQRLSGAADYQRMLKAIQYDLLEGKRYLFGGTAPYTPTNLEK